MLFARSSASHLTKLCLSLLAMLILTLIPSCRSIPATTYSIEEQFDLSHTRSVELANQLQFSFRLEPENVPIGQDIFFVATITNTTNQPIVFRELSQDRILEQEDFDTTILFLVKPVSKDMSILYPGQGFVDRNPEAIRPDEFVTLPPHSSHEIRLQLPHMVYVKYFPVTVFSAEYSPLPVGQYRVQLIYINHVIGYRVEAGDEFRYVDLIAWVGRVEADPVILTITSGK